MPTQDTSKIKEDIISLIQQRGPSLPVHVAKKVDLSILFASAFLSELLSEKKIRISNMRVGSSPIYYIPGQEYRLESFSLHLNNKEKEAFMLLQTEKVLKDNEQEPAIRVALRSIKDFAIPFKEKEEIFWRYFTTEQPRPKVDEIKKVEVQKEPEPKIETPRKPELKKEIPKEPESKKEVTEKIETPVTKKVEIFDKPAKKTKKSTPKNNEKFFNKVKDFLSQNNIEISDIVSFNKNELILKIKENNEEILMVAYNKRRINEEDIIKAHKKVANTELKYKILSLGDPLKKVNEFIEAINNLKNIEKINNNL